MTEDFDYKLICKKLLGTDDPKVLNSMTKNIRNAGRKAKFNKEEILAYIALGHSVCDTAKHFNTSRQLIHNYINPEKKENCPLRLIFMKQNTPLSYIDVDFLNKKIYLTNRTNCIFDRAFGIIENPNWDDFEYFLKDRCFEKGRDDIENILKTLNIQYFDEIEILEKLSGRTAEDKKWIKFEYEK